MKAVDRLRPKSTNMLAGTQKPFLNRSLVIAYLWGGSLAVVTANKTITIAGWNQQRTIISEYQWTYTVRLRGNRHPLSHGSAKYNMTTAWNDSFKINSVEGIAGYPSHTTLVFDAGAGIVFWWTKVA